MSKKVFSYLWPLLALVLTGCPGKVVPTPEPEKDSLTITLSSPFTSDGSGNWTGEVPDVGIEAAVTVESSAPWTATAGASWCTLSPAKGSNRDKQTTLTVSKNSDFSPRSTTVTIKSGSLSCTVEVRQKEAEKEAFSLSPEQVELEQEGGTFSVKITCATTYKLSSTPEWVKDITKPGSGKTHTFSVGANPLFEVRSGVVVFCDDAGTCIPLAVSQKARQGTAYQMDWSKDFYHRSLVMDFTGTWCGFCPRMQRGMHMLSEEYPDKINMVAMHDANSTLSFNGTTSLASLYKVSSFPNVIFDGRCKISNGGYKEDNYNSLLSAYKESVAGLPTVSATGLSSTLSGENLQVYADVYVKKAGSYKITLFLLEDGIVAAQADNDNGASNDYIHDHVARMALTSFTGDEFKASSDNSTVSFSYSASLPTKYKKENLTLLAFVQRAYDGSVSKIKASDFDGYFVDNSVSAPLGADIPPALVNGYSGGNEEFNGGNPVNW